MDFELKHIPGVPGAAAEQGLSGEQYADEESQCGAESVRNTKISNVAPGVEKMKRSPVEVHPRLIKPTQYFGPHALIFLGLQ